MSKKYQYFEGNKDKEFNISEMRKYVKTKQEIDKILERIISPVIKEKKLNFILSLKNYLDKNKKNYTKAHQYR